jgi:ABC-type Fe3+/spermidine/putrescine transport system ATPase subunit
VFDDLNLAAEPGEIIVIFGSSGTGKTILLRLIAGVEEPTSGLIEIEAMTLPISPLSIAMSAWPSKISPFSRI